MKRYPSLYFGTPEFAKLFEMKTGVSVSVRSPHAQTNFAGETAKVQNALALLEEAVKLQFPQNVERIFGPAVIWPTQPQDAQQAMTIMSKYNPRPNGTHFPRFNTTSRAPVGVLTWTNKPAAIQEKIAKWEAILADVKERRNPTAVVTSEVNPVSNWLDLREFELHNSSIVRAHGPEWLLWAETKGIADVAAQRLKTVPLLASAAVAEPKLVTLSSTSTEAVEFLRNAIDKLIVPGDRVVAWDEQGSNARNLALSSRLAQASSLIDTVNVSMEDSFAQLVRVPTTQAAVDAVTPDAAKLALFTLGGDAGSTSTLVLVQAASRKALTSAKDQVLALQHEARPYIASAPAPSSTVLSEPRSLAPKIDLTSPMPPSKRSGSPVSYSPPTTVKAVIDLTKPIAAKVLAPKMSMGFDKPAAEPPAAPVDSLAALKAVAPKIDLTARIVKPAPAAPVSEAEAPIKISSPASPISFVEDVDLPPSRAALDLTKKQRPQQQRPVLNLVSMTAATSLTEEDGGGAPAIRERPRLDLSGGADSSRRAPRFHANFFTKLDVPTEYVGKLIGRGGSAMRELETQTNARVKFQDEEDVSVCTISALTEADMENAEAYIRAKLAQFEQEEADYLNKRGSGGVRGADGEFTPRRRNQTTEATGTGMDDFDSDDQTAGDYSEDPDGYVDHYAPIIDPEFMKKVWFKHTEDPRLYTNEALALEFKAPREDIDAIMFLMRMRADYVERNMNDEELMDDSYERMNAEHMGVYTPEFVDWDDMPRPFLTPKFRFVAYNSKLACKNYNFATNSEEILSNTSDYVYLPGVHVNPKPKPELMKEKTTTVDGWVITKVTKDNRNYRNARIKEWNETGPAQRKAARLANNEEMLVREGLIQVGHGKYKRVGHYTPTIRASLLPRHVAGV